jgi:hypothetical protein
LPETLAKVLANASLVGGWLEVIRRESNNPDSVEVYDIGAGGEATATQVGETVSVVRTGTL